MKTLPIALGLAALLGSTVDSAPATPEDAPPALSADESRAIDAAAASELERFSAPGMVLAVVRGDSVIYRAASGVANVETGEPMTPDLMVSVASVSKTVTAATALVLALEGRLDLDAPVRNYLPALPERLGAVTMAQLLSHTAGLADRMPGTGPSPIDGSLLPVARTMNENAVLAAPGEVFAYSNLGYVLAGAVIEAAGGAPFPQMVRQTLFTPLGMTRSTFDPRVAMTYRHAQGHDTLGPEPVVLRPFNSFPPWMPAAELITTVDDLARLARALLSDGMLDGQRVLPRGVLARMATLRSQNIGNFGNGRFGYGMGLAMREHHGLHVREHAGFYSGFGAYFCLEPDRNLAAIAVVNGRGAVPLRSTQAALEVAAGLPPEWTEPACQALPPHAASAALGRYDNGESRNTIEIALANGTAVLRQGKDSYPITVRADGVWEIHGYLPFLPFPATPLELIAAEPGHPPLHLRFGWRLYRRQNPVITD